jgi:RNA polymerase sigma factor (sigma-70 family)
MPDFQQLVDDHYTALYRFALSLCRNQDTACDLVQQTFCIWAQKGGQLQDHSKAKTWLFTTLHREFLAHNRKARRYQDEELTDQVTASLASEEDQGERQLDGQRLMQLLQALDENYRAPVTLFYLQQHSYREIAEILDIPIGTVMSRISRGKEILRRKMTSEPASAPKNILHLEPSRITHHG